MVFFKFDTGEKSFTLLNMGKINSLSIQECSPYEDTSYSSKIIIVLKDGKSDVWYSTNSVEELRARLDDIVGLVF